jgi:hypothetical protein
MGACGRFVAAGCTSISQISHATPFIMKIFSALFLAASMASASAFVPSTGSSSSTTTQLHESLFKKISNLDLWAPVADSNDYGARSKKKIVTGKLTEKSYIPSGLTKAQYEKIRAEADKKKAANYQKNVAKAGVFDNYTEFYLKRGSDEGGNWLNLPNLGHRMAKTKYDWSGETEGAFVNRADGAIKEKAGATKKAGVAKKGAAVTPPKKKSFFGL